MTSITNLLKTNLMLNRYLMIQAVLRMKSKDVYEEFFKRKRLFEFSNFSRDFKFYYNKNQMVAGKMKIVYRRILVNKFVGLKSKIFSMLSDDGKESNTAKGVNIATEFNGFRDTLFNKKTVKNEKENANCTK